MKTPLSFSRINPGTKTLRLRQGMEKPSSPCYWLQVSTNPCTISSFRSETWIRWRNSPRNSYQRSFRHLMNQQQYKAWQWRNKLTTMIFLMRLKLIHVYWEAEIHPLLKTMLWGTSKFSLATVGTIITVDWRLNSSHVYEACTCAVLALWAIVERGVYIPLIEPFYSHSRKTWRN